MHPDPILAKACHELVSVHAAHTILLYGSRADGSAGADSDYDIAAFCSGEKSFRIARLSGDAYLDIFVYPESRLLLPTEAELKLRGSRILLQRETEAETFLRQLEELFRRGPNPLTGGRRKTHPPPLSSVAQASHRVTGQCLQAGAMIN